MKIRVERFHDDGAATLSLVRVDGAFRCFGLEDEGRAVKVAGETRIPAGTYPVRVRTFGGFHARYAARFAAWHRGMLEIAGVPGFTDVLIHIGNTEADTAGCLLVGAGCAVAPAAVIRSAAAYEALYKAAIGRAEAGQLTIEFTDPPTKE